MKIRYIILCFSIFLLTGCWNYRELEDQAIVGAIGIDIDKDQFSVSAEIINPKKTSNSQSGSGSNSDESPVIIYEEKAKTIREALTRMVSTSPKRLYIGHMELLVISEEAAKKGIYELIDFFMRDIESRKIFDTVVAKNDKAINILKVIEPLENVTATKIRSSFEAINHYYGNINNASFDEMVMCLFSTGHQPTIAAVEIKGKVEDGDNTKNLSETKAKTSVEIVGAALFKSDKLIGYINEKEALFYSMISSKVPTTYLSFKCDDKDNYANVAIDNIKSSFKIKIENNFPVAEITVSGKAALTEINCNIDIRNPKNINTIQKMVNKEIKKQMYNVISKVQKYNTDIFGYEEQLYRNNNKYWEKNKKKWDTIFPKITSKVKSNIEVERVSSSIDTAKSRWTDE